ncbi:hypothetical protein MKW98_028367 [Papaver atlanticum]|uniref:Uncharacterized protein n=1 Tax=Papaver atlanticum TaxID=357466 RepID=A0AAD4XNE4_9MAGN|nr:hypothetical protein MKW98_028367 [Papaver atlanticum]
MKTPKEDTEGEGVGRYFESYKSKLLFVNIQKTKKEEETNKWFIYLIVGLSGIGKAKHFELPRFLRVQSDGGWIDSTTTVLSSIG